MANLNCNADVWFPVKIKEREFNKQFPSEKTIAGVKYGYWRWRIFSAAVSILANGRRVSKGALKVMEKILDTSIAEA